MEHLTTGTLVMIGACIAIVAFSIGFLRGSLFQKKLQSNNNKSIYK